MSNRFPTTLEGFGYVFNEKGQLRHKKSGAPFKFDVKPGNQAYNQKHYEAFGEVITEYLYTYMIEELGLDKILTPMDASENEPQGFVFATPDFHINRAKLMVLIHGSGAVRAGQWARKLIVNDCLDTGTQFPYIRRAVAAGYAVIVLNTNQNKAITSATYSRIRGSESPEKHGRYVFDRLIRERCPAEKIAIVAHSYGGFVTTSLSKLFETEFQSRVGAIALTDSVHAAATGGLTPHFIKVGRNWVTSTEPLDSKKVLQRKNDVVCVSAGTTDHGTTSSSSIDSVFQFIKDQLADFKPRKTYSLRSIADEEDSALAAENDTKYADKEL